uniref:C2 domain-containing protein n=1 Tax=Ditylenchus dipsaci TaxID=166011 RepID=A0A915DAZ3_9BILA
MCLTRQSPMQSSDSKRRTATCIVQEKGAKEQQIRSQLAEGEGSAPKESKKNSIRKMSKAIGISKSSVYRIAKIELGMKARKEVKAQLLTDTMKENRLDRCKKLLRYEKGFDLEQAHNPQNDRIWSKDPLPLEERIVSRSQKPKQVMVWAGVTHNGKTPLIFVPEGVKVRGPGYRSMLKRSAAMDTGTFWRSSMDLSTRWRSIPSCRGNFPDAIKVDVSWQRADGEWPSTRQTSTSWRQNNSTCSSRRQPVWHPDSSSRRTRRGSKRNCQFRMSWQRTGQKDFFGKSDPFLEFYRILEDGSRQMVHRTEVIKKTVNPEWKPFEMTVRHLCENNKDRKCYDYDSDGSHDFIGSCQLSLNALTAKRENNFPLINEKKQKKKGAKYKDSGVLHFLHVDVRKEYTFLDFVTSGMQLEFAVAVDFTSSNGPVHSTTSPLHQPFLSQPIRNGHQGCNLATFDRFTNGVTGVLEAYKIALMNTQLYGPTNFAPTINEFSNKAKQFPPDGSRYQVLLIITDGIITDMEKTKAAIISASDLPISIIITAFPKRKICKRDIVQFVPFRNFMTTPINGNINDEQQAHVQSLLAKEVLAEVPEQVTSYMKSKRIAPLEDWAIFISSKWATPSSAPQQSAIPYPTNNYYPNIGGPAVVDPGVLADGLRTNLHLHSSAPPPSS